MDKTGKYGVLNVVLHPHPQGAYRNIFERAARDTRAVKYYGDRFAKISPVSETRNGVFTGRLATWSEIDPDSNLIEKRTLNEVLLAESEVRLPEGIGFNSRVFSFAFHEASHKLFVETRNDENENISINLARNAISRILELVSEGAELDVFVVSSANALARVLSTPNIKKIEIQVDLPNPDVLTANKRQIVEALNKMHAKRMKTEIVKRAGPEGLELTEGVRAFAELGMENGYTKAFGSENGRSVERSTKDFPLAIETVLGVEESRAAATRRIAETNDDRGI